MVRRRSFAVRTRAALRMLACSPVRTPAYMLLLLCACCLLPACSHDPRLGYSFEESVPEGVATVFVPTASNQTYTTGIESELTEAVIKRVQVETPVRVVQRAAGADSTLTIEITNVSMRRISSSSGTGLVQEVAVSLTLDVDWRDSRTGKLLAARRGLRATDSFLPSRPTREGVEVGEHGAVQRAAAEVVSLMRSAW